ncbi:MAG: hypothetical protein EOM12_08835 [Verrucomicrobiae bacterium]|nr:hypothetical protein [Verrucomicrobiae bacterium]
MKVGWFQKEQILEKGNEADMEKLCAIIEQSHILSVRHRYIQYFEAMETITRDMENRHRLARVLEATEQCKKPGRSVILGDGRHLVESLVNMLCRRFDVIPNEKSTTDNLQTLGPKWNERRHCLEDGYITLGARSCGKAAYSLCSNYGAHDDPKKPEPEPPEMDIFLCALHAIRAFVMEVEQPR